MSAPKFVRALAATGLAAASILAVNINGDPAAAAQADVGRLVSAFAQCAQAEKAADIVLLLDRSESLKQSDAAGIRRTAGRSFLDDLADFAGFAQVNLRLQVAGFNGGYDAGAWRELPADLPAAEEDVDRLSDPAQLGSATDYWVALDGARQQLRKSSAECQLVVWFTDGMYDIDENGRYGQELPYAEGMRVTDTPKAKIIDRGIASLCSPNGQYAKPVGPVNALRANGVYLATVVLGNPADEKAGQASRLLNRLTTGAADCGNAPRPAQGALIPATQAADLGRELAQLSGGAARKSRYDRGRATQSFTLDDTVNGVTVLADADASGTRANIRIGLRGPADKHVVWFGKNEFQATEGAQRVSGGHVALKFQRVSDRAMRFRLERSAKGWDGKWKVIFQSDRKLPAGTLSHTVLKVWGDLEAVWTKPVAQIGAGQPLALQIAVRHRDGSPLSGRHPGVRVSVQLKDRSNQVVQLQTALTVDALEQPVQVDIPNSAGPAHLMLTLDARIGKDTALVPQRTSTAVKIAAPGTYPSIDAESLTFPDAAGLAPASAQLNATGPGCVWVDTSRLAESLGVLPDGFTAVTVSTEFAAEDECLKLAKGQTAALPLTLTPVASDEHGGNGSVAGSLQIMAKPAEGAGKPQLNVVDFSEERTKLANVRLQWLVLVVGLLAGLGIPAALMLATRAKLAKIPTSSDEQGELAYVQKSVRVVDGRVVSADGAPLTISREQIRIANPGAGGEVTLLEVAGVAIKARVFGNPFAVPDAVASRTDGAVISDSSSGVTPKGTATLPLALQSHWVAWREGADRLGVVAFLPMMQTSEQDLPEMSRRFSESLASSSAILAELAREVAGQGGDKGQPAADPYDSFDPTVSGWSNDGSWGSGGAAATVALAPLATSAEPGGFQPAPPGEFRPAPASSLDPQAEPGKGVVAAAGVVSEAAAERPEPAPGPDQPPPAAPPLDFGWGAGGW